jgi:predicted RNA binding protein YcfA (HicA-like mRNA interferase family)
LSKVPLLSWLEVVKVPEKAGFEIARQKGSHLILIKDECIVPVPKHEQIRRGLLMAIIVDAGLTKEEFLKLLK